MINSYSVSNLTDVCPRYVSNLRCRLSSACYIVFPDVVFFKTHSNWFLGLVCVGCLFCVVVIFLVLFIDGLCLCFLCFVLGVLVFGECLFLVLGIFVFLFLVCGWFFVVVLFFSWLLWYFGCLFCFFLVREPGVVSLSMDDDCRTGYPIFSSTVYFLWNLISSCIYYVSSIWLAHIALRTCLRVWLCIINFITV